MSQTFVYRPVVVGATAQIECPVSTFCTYINIWTNLVIFNMTDTCTPAANLITINLPANTLPPDMATRTVRVVNIVIYDFYTVLVLVPVSLVSLLVLLLLFLVSLAPLVSPAPGTAAVLLILNSN